MFRESRHGLLDCVSSTDENDHFLCAGYRSVEQVPGQHPIKFATNRDYHCRELGSLGFVDSARKSEFQIF